MYKLFFINKLINFIYKLFSILKHLQKFNLKFKY